MDVADFDAETAKYDSRPAWDRFFLGYPISFERFDDAEREGIFVGRFEHAIFVIYWAIGLSLLRLLFNKFVARPIGRWGKIKEAPVSPPRKNTDLEQVFSTCRGRPKKHHIERGVAVTGLGYKYVARWFDRRRRVGQPTQLDKFCEETWRLTYYFAVSVYGFVVLYDKSWFQDPMLCWLGLGSQPFPDDVRIYYYVQLGMYVSLLAFIARDNERKDYWEQVIHHLVTISLMGFSYVQGYYRIGSLVLLVHDFADVFLEAAKAAFNLKYQATSEALFVVFAVAFCASRIVVYPWWILRNVAIGLSTVAVRMGGYNWFYLVLLGTLQILHLFWFRTIVVMAYKFIAKGKLEGDARSDDELEDSEDDDDAISVASKKDR